jgi:DNA (cytosine-5)-methyltransferase 1
LAKAIALEVMNVLGIKPSKPEMVQELGEEKLLQFTMSDAAKYYGVNPKIIEEVTSASGHKSLTT